MLIDECQQFFKPTQSRFLHLPCIHPLPISLQPVKHIMLFQPMARRIAVIGFYDVRDLLPLHPIIEIVPFL